MVDTRRQQIEDVASALFRERGYAATSVRDIAQRLNIQGPTLYAHVASKEDVLWSIVERAARRFHAAVAALADADGTAADRLRSMARAHVEVVTSDLGHATVFLHEWRFLGPARRAAIGRERDEYEARFRRVIEQGTASGEFRDVDPRLAAVAILSALNGVAGWYRPDGRLTPGRIADELADLFIGGLARPSDPSLPSHRRSRR